MLNGVYCDAHVGDDVGVAELKARLRGMLQSQLLPLWFAQKSGEKKAQQVCFRVLVCPCACGQGVPTHSSCCHWRGVSGVALRATLKHDGTVPC